MKEINEIIIIKLGGSVLTDKNQPFSIRTDVMRLLIDQIVSSKKNLIIIHGGGSYGHPLAKQYQIVGGLDPSIENQPIGIAETHAAMMDLNSKIVDYFLAKRFPVISFQPSAIFMIKNNMIFSNSLEPIEASLDLGITPILYGDIILDTGGNFSIISGDRIILEICTSLKKYKVSKVIFAIEKDGIFIQVENEIKLLDKIESSQIDDIPLANLDNKIDVTGGILGKLKSIQKICALNIPVQILNGIKQDILFKAIQGQDVTCTSISLTNVKKDEIRQRKIEHLKIPLKRNVQYSENYFQYVKLIHHALPSIALEEIDISISLFNKKLSAPICISAMTGGHPVAQEINKILAMAAEQENILMSVGSQRAAIEDPSIESTYSIVREVAPTISIMGNLGVGQLSNEAFTLESFKKAIDIIKADIMAIHFNPLHELVQHKGDISYRLFKDNFKKVREQFQIPIIAKEVGAGLNSSSIKGLDRLGFDGFDVGGSGGTSFAAIEAFRNNNYIEKFNRNIADSFREWGIPTPVSTLYTRSVTNKPIIATGGLNNGIDLAKSIALGADLGGYASQFLISAWKDLRIGGFTNTLKEIKTIKEELRNSLWLTNCSSINDLKNNPKKRILLGPLYEWINQ